MASLSDSFSDSFSPARLLASGHLQTLTAAAPLFLRDADAPDTELRFPIADGGALHAAARFRKEKADAVIVIHGIGGSRASRYVIRAAQALSRAGYHVVRLDLRGAGDSLGDAPSLYHAGLTEDVARAVRMLARDPRVSGVRILGFSGGGGIALKLAGEAKLEEITDLRAIASISAPLDYTRIGPWIDRAACFPYRIHVLRGLIAQARGFAKVRPDRVHYDPKSLSRVGKVRAYDEKVIVPMHGFDDVDSYWAAASAGPWLDRVKVPSLVLHAEDDPMVPGHTVRPSLKNASRDVHAELTKRGGHIGFIEGWDEPSWTESYAMQRVLAFFRKI